MQLARTLLEQHNMPICIINGAVGGTRIDQHLRNESNPEDGNTIYGRLLTRVKAAKLTHDIRAVLWHQNDQDQGREGPFGGDFDYKWYPQNFVNLSGAWKQNFPNIKNYYIYQVWPAACGDTSANDMLRETQRILPYLYSNMHIMSTLGVVPGSGCHYSIAGYEFMDTVPVGAVSSTTAGVGGFCHRKQFRFRHRHDCHHRASGQGGWWEIVGSSSRHRALTDLLSWVWMAPGRMPGPQWRGHSAR